jgi:hypothetical protein
MRDLGLSPGKARRRDGVSSWDLRVDGRRRHGIPVTVIHAPGVGCLVWVPFAPPLRDEFRKSYRKLLRWNEEYPFVKFGVTEDERPVMGVEVAEASLGQETLGEALARCVAMCDHLAAETVRWQDGTGPFTGRAASGAQLLERYADRLRELTEPT